MAILSPQADPRQLVLDKDFSVLTDVDESVWRFDDGPVHNNEAQKYTLKPAKNAWIEDGCLVLEARKKDGVITSARLQSVAAWKHGKVEVVAKVPTGKGTWPAIWMLGDSLRQNSPLNFVPWPKCGEIDIMENVGFDPFKFYFTLHSEKFNHMKGTQMTEVVTIPDETPAFHTYTLDWRPGKIEMAMDGKVVFSREKGAEGEDGWPFEAPHYLILNLAIGGFWGGAKGIDESIFPSRFLIKSVKVWQ